MASPNSRPRKPTLVKPADSALYIVSKTDAFRLEDLPTELADPRPKLPRRKPLTPEQKRLNAIWMRNNPTKAEAIMHFWLLRTCLTVAPDLPELIDEIRPQHLLMGYIPDFYIPLLKVVIECDGWSHRTKRGRAHDKIRDDAMLCAGLTVVRFRNEAITTQTPIFQRRVTALIRRLHRAYLRSHEQ